MAEDVDALRKELDDARAEIARLQSRLTDARRRTDIFQSIQEFRKDMAEHLGWKSWEQSAYGIGKTLAEGVRMPKKRETLAVTVLFSLLPMSLLTTVFLVWLAVFRDSTGLLAVALVVYFGHIFFDKSSEQGGKPSSWVKDHVFWRHATNYFPMELQKMNPDTLFPSDVVYLFGYHPHGVIGVGCFLNFMTSATGLPHLFPGLDFRGGTLGFNFSMPFFREVLLRLGAITVSARSIKHVLRRGPGSAVIIVPGGAAEALDARPGAHDLTLHRRNGFFRIALQHGVHLVPIYSFGENELYEQVMPNRPGSMIRNIQENMLRHIGYSMPYFLGAGSQPVPGSGSGVPLNPVPRRHPVITVVGDPIPCEAIENPTQEQIDAVKEKYINNLKEIFKLFADKYAPGSGDLRIVK